MLSRWRSVPRSAARRCWAFLAEAARRVRVPARAFRERPRPPAPHVPEPAWWRDWGEEP